MYLTPSWIEHLSEFLRGHATFKLHVCLSWLTNKKHLMFQTGSMNLYPDDIHVHNIIESHMIIYLYNL